MGLAEALSNHIGFGPVLAPDDDAPSSEPLYPTPDQLYYTDVSTPSSGANVMPPTWTFTGFENPEIFSNVWEMTTLFPSNSTGAAYDNTTVPSNETSNDPFSMAADMFAAVSKIRNIEQQIWLIGAPMVIFLGTLGNVLSAFVMSRKCMRRSVTGFYLLVLAFADTLVLYTGLLRLWLKETYQHDLRSTGIGVCKFHSFLVYWSSDFAAWVIVIVTLERFLSVVFPHHAKNLVTRRMAVISLLILGTLLIFINCHLLNSSDLITVILQNGIEVTFCGLKPGYFVENVWPWMDFATFSLVPFVLLILCNCAILAVLVSAHFRRQHLNLVSGNSPRMTTMTAILLVVSFTFFLLTAPISIYLILQRTWINSSDPLVDAQVGMVWAIVNILSYSNNAINFLLYCITGSKFRSQLAIVFKCPCAFNRIAPVVNNTNNTNTTGDL